MWRSGARMRGDVVEITVPAARMRYRPVYIGPDPFEGTYRRNGDGDYRCDRDEVVAMMRDSSQLPLDRQLVVQLGLESLDMVSVARYRRRFADTRPDHPWWRLSDEDFLLRAEAIGRDPADRMLKPTRAGLLFFGYEYEITREFPYYFLDYRRRSSGADRWDDRVVSSDGTWSGNLHDFWDIVINRLWGAVAHPFRLDAGEKAGNGFDTMRQGCDFVHVPYPELTVSYNPDRVTLFLHTRRVSSRAGGRARTGPPDGTRGDRGRAFPFPKPTWEL